MQRFYLAQDGHTVPLIFPQDETGGKTSAAFAMKMYSHVSIIVMIGVSAAAPGLMTLKACTNAAGANPVAIPFDLFACETANSDVLGARVAVLAAGYQPPATDNIFYVIEVNAEQLPQGSPYLVLTDADGANSVIAAAVAILSGSRFANDQSPTVLV